jgi:hypothetical protein
MIYTMDEIMQKQRLKKEPEDIEHIQDPVTLM